MRIVAEVMRVIESANDIMSATRISSTEATRSTGNGGKTIARPDSIGLAKTAVLDKNDLAL
jgi:hypothetical protein